MQIAFGILKNGRAALIAIDPDDVVGQILAGDETAPFAAGIGDCKTLLPLALNPMFSL